MEERDLPNILANYCCDLLDWACEQGLTKDEALQVMRDVADRDRVSAIRNTVCTRAGSRRSLERLEIGQRSSP